MSTKHGGEPAGQRSGVFSDILPTMPARVAAAVRRAASLGSRVVSTSMVAGLGEVEVKYRVADEDATQLVEALAASGVVLSAPVRQDDQAYAPAGWRFGLPKIGVTFGRLRSQGGQVLFTVKVPRANELDCVEHETMVADRAAMHEALLVMGMAPTVRIIKDRRMGSWEGTLVCLDVVEGLGTFVELERVVPAAMARQAQIEMDRQVRGLGVQVQRVTQTYDSLIRELTA